MSTDPGFIQGTLTITLVVVAAFLALNSDRMADWLTKTLLGPEPERERPEPTEPIDPTDALRVIGPLPKWRQHE